MVPGLGVCLCRAILVLGIVFLSKRDQDNEPMRGRLLEINQTPINVELLAGGDIHTFNRMLLSVDYVHLTLQLCV